MVPGPDADLATNRAQATTLWHPAGTCKIGRDASPWSIRSYGSTGIEGLRVADASVMPTVTSGNTVAGCL